MFLIVILVTYFYSIMDYLEIISLTAFNVQNKGNSMLKIYSLMLILAIGIYGCGGGSGSSSSGTSSTPTTPPADPGNGVTSSNSTTVGTGACQAEVSWGQPLTMTDSTPVTSSDISGYKIYYGTSTGVYIGTPVDVAGEAADAYAHTLKGLSCSQKYFFSITAYDTTGAESDYSSEVSKTL